MNPDEVSELWLVESMWVIVSMANIMSEYKSIWYFGLLEPAGTSYLDLKGGRVTQSSSLIQSVVFPQELILYIYLYVYISWNFAFPL